MSHCLDINVDMEDITWSKELETASDTIHNENQILMYDTDDNDYIDGANSDETTNFIETKQETNIGHKHHQPNPQMLEEKNSLKTDNLSNNKVNQQRMNINSVTPPPTIKMTYNMCKSFIENKIVILVDIQFVGDEPVEIVVARPDYPIVFHDVYPVCCIRKPNRPFNLLTHMPNTAKTNQKTFENNVRYVNMECCQGYNGFHCRPLKNNTNFYKTLPDDAIYILRGINKHIYWRNLLKFYNKTGNIYLFNDQFYSPSLDRRSKRPTGHYNCIHHTDKTSACSLANVYQMAMEYEHCKHMFYEYQNK